MSDFAIRWTVLFDEIANSVGRILLSPIGFLPEYVGAMLIAIVTGIVMLVAFKYTSNQTAIKRVRDLIKSEFLALSLFNDSVAVNLRSQWRIILGAIRLAMLSLVPIAVMIVPVGLLLGQLSLWWQARPLHPGEETVVTLNLAGGEETPWPDVNLQPSAAIETTLGPIHIRSKRAVCWNVQAREPGYHKLVFSVDGQDVEKELAVGDRPMRVSRIRPDWNWSDVLLNPAELPFSSRSAVRSIEIQYPDRSSWVAGSHSWIVFWFLASTIAALCFRGVFKVNL